jgi:hypothetical protein
LLSEFTFNPLIEFRFLPMSTDWLSVDMPRPACCGAVSRVRHLECCRKTTRVVKKQHVGGGAGPGAQLAAAGNKQLDKARRRA